MVALAKPQQLIEMEAREPRGKSSEWFTSPRYIEAARRVLGQIDLDPASCELANKTVKARRYYTAQENGLAQDWSCESMWLNPPFGRQNASTTTRFGGGKSIMGLFVSKMVEGYQSGMIKQSIALVTAKPDASWFAQLWNYPLCFATHRVLFSRVDDSLEGHFYGTVFAYLGSNERLFIEEFSRFGVIAKRVSTPPIKPTPLSLWEVQ